MVQVNGGITVSRVVVLTVHRQDRSVTYLMVPVYLGVYQDGGEIPVTNPVILLVNRQDRSVPVPLVPVCMVVYREDWRITGTLETPVILLSVSVVTALLLTNLDKLVYLFFLEKYKSNCCNYVPGFQWAIYIHQYISISSHL